MIKYNSILPKNTYYSKLDLKLIYHPDSQKGWGVFRVSALLNHNQHVKGHQACKHVDFI